MTTTRQSRLGWSVPAGAIAVAAMIALAPAANAQSEQQIKSGCDEADGNYSTIIDTGANVRYSVCCYHDDKGHPYCDTYVNGSYTGTFAGIRRPGPPTGQPVAPPSKTSPPPEAPPPVGPNPVTGNNPPVAPPITNGPPAANVN
jgi:hypothetical protein